MNKTFITLAVVSSMLLGAVALADEVVPQGGPCTFCTASDSIASKFPVLVYLDGSQPSHQITWVEYKTLNPKEGRSEVDGSVPGVEGYVAACGCSPTQYQQWFGHPIGY